MVTTANRLEWVIVRTEFEALQLEFTWIKEFNPPFNIQFMDDKSYPYLAISLGDAVPRAFITRRRGNKKTAYFGPYTKAWAIRETLDTIIKPFPVRTCSDSSYETAVKTKRACLLGDIGKCAAPCVGRVSEDEHRHIANNMARFLQGNDDDVIAQLRERMLAASARHDYERAAKLRDSIVALDAVAEKSAVVLPREVDADVYGLVRDAISVAVSQFIVRGGRVRGARSWTVDVDDSVPTSALMDDLLRGAYLEDAPPRLIIVPELPEDDDALSQWLLQQRRHILDDSRAGAVELRIPQRGDFSRLSETVTANATHTLELYKTRRNSDYLTRSQALVELGDYLGLANPPLRIECFDVSHLSGTNIVASMVVFEDGLAKRRDYRSFNIDSATDDTDAMKQTLSRRLKYLSTSAGEANRSSRDTDDENPTSSSFSYEPGLLLIDGGKPQVGVAAAAVREAGLSIPVVGIAKRLEELWLPDDPYPVILPRNSHALYILQALRDEAHRFAITHQRKKRSRSVSSVLAEIPGLGPARVAQLLRSFGSVARLRSASRDEILAVPGISAAIADAIVAKLAAGEASPVSRGEG